jgi:mannose-6-phosphate isomerase-like protein (cupin superfamily)
MRLLAISLVAAVLGGCHSHGPTPSVITPDAFRRVVEWTEADRAKPIAKLDVSRDASSSHHIIRLAGPEKPHVHDRHDLTVSVMSGRARLHVADEVHEMGPGDVALIPHGMRHWAEPIGGVAQAYVIFTPPFDGADTRPVD